MERSELSVLTEIAKTTQSELIIFFIIIAVVVIVVVVPMYILVLRDRRYRSQLDSEKYSNYIEVIKANTSVMSELKSTLELVVLKATFEREKLARMIEEVLRNNSTTEASLNRILTIVDGRKKSDE